MRRAARLFSFGGGLAIVLALSKYHARWVATPPDDFTGSFRFTWAIGYAALLSLAV